MRSTVLDPDQSASSVAMGAGSGISAALAINWAARAMHVIGTDDDMASAAAAISQISSTPGNAHACSAIPENDADQCATHRLRRF
ncbi:MULTISPECIES: hypothetical protein [unclassified Mesorhizobium]|uniref:hypothetical protein n=1 Tax=unclassified Mesorhizobium TaxID=325217 RepID=UPI000FDBC3EA|nr:MULTISPECIES: hypothetical protein [unclassified Mesorhizobium]TGR16894.1 hypothetical protein EN845_31770 [Mesorhizobium sp. M8A.F.Ca.ET.202.01.1.1]TGU17708.1 hypothetical protein EN799_62510 [bacterium M00.F.Ca.ET.156.01.1.1]